MFKGLSTLKLWQKVVLLVVAIGVAWGIYGIYDWMSSPELSEGSTDYAQLATVAYGDLTNSIFASGSLVYSTSEQLTFDSGGTVQEVNVEKDDLVKEGDVLARLESTTTLILSLEEEVASARVVLRDAEDAVEDLLNPYDESEIADAEEAVERASQRLLNIQEQAFLDIENAEYELDEAVDVRFDVLNQYMNGVVSYEEVEKAYSDHEAKVLNLEIVKQDAENAIYDAERNLEEAEEDLADMVEVVDPLDIELAESVVASAKGKLEDALEELEMASDGYPLLAPFDGVIARVNDDAAPGDDVNANTVIVEIVDTSVIEMSAVVDEIDVPLVELGQQAIISLDALSDIQLSGEVVRLSAFAEVKSGIVQYPVTISLTVPSDIQLREGMSATAEIVVQAVSDVLLVPNDAISGTTDNSRVTVLVDGQPQVRAVSLGTSDYQWTEVVEGLQEGDVVIVEVAATGATESVITGGGPMMPGGGFPGGGRGFP
ncbi:MAG: HlyD family efflux transporter periplasmic adaptor subunit [Chloroflexota bacterium]|nr:HlyD family efflux transporter periplasmic adaptor subunit [Chloroflexota bacterium]